MRRITQIVGAAFALLALFTASAAARSPRVAVSHAARLPHSAKVTGPAAADKPVPLWIGLRGRDPLGLQALSSAVSDRHSPEFGHFLTRRQFAARFGATRSEMATIKRVLRAQGLRIQRTDSDNLGLDVIGSAATVQRALATKLVDVRLPDGVRGVANTTTATLPGSIASDVQVIEGLNPAAMARPTLPPQPKLKPTAHPATPAPHARRHVVTGGPQPCAAASAVGTPQTLTNGFKEFGYTADLIATYYGFSSLYAAGDFGQGQSIALPEGEVIDPNDIVTYAQCYGLAPSITDHVIGTKGPVDDGDGDGEVSLDIEQLISLAPQAHVDIFEKDGQGSLSDSTIAAAVSANTDKVISISYGACESVFGSDYIKQEAKLFQEGAVQGQSVVASSGDTGSEGCYSSQDPDTTTVQADNYASQPDVLGIGATSLYAGGTGASEVPWNAANSPIEGVWNIGGYQAADGSTAYAATGGGVSSTWKMPSYQSGAAAGLGVINSLSNGRTCGASSGDCRQVPDVSADGDALTGYAVFSNLGDGNPSSWFPQGGTSASAPLWAAALALTNAQPSCRGATLGLPNPFVYAAAGANYAAFFRDTTAPNPSTAALSNDVTGQAGGLYPTTAGYDMTTGLGTPNVGALAPELCALRAPVYTVAIAKPKTRTAYLGTKFSLKIRTSDSGGLPVTVAVKGLPKGLSFSAKKATISGKAKRRGSYKIAVSASDYATNSASYGFTLRVKPKPLAKPKISGVALHGVGRRHPQLKFTVTQRGRKGSKAKSVTISLPKGLSFGKRNKGIHLAGPHRRHHRAAKVRYHAKRRHGKLTITFKSKQSKVTVSIGRGTLFAKKKIATTARKHAKHKVAVGINVTDAQRYTGRHTFHLRFKK